MLKELSYFKHHLLVYRIYSLCSELDLNVKYWPFVGRERIRQIHNINLIFHDHRFLFCGLMNKKTISFALSITWEQLMSRFIDVYVLNLLTLAVDNTVIQKNSDEEMFKKVVIILHWQMRFCLHNVIIYLFMNRI